MKRIFVLLTFSLLLAGRGALAQDTTPTAPAPALTNDHAASTAASIAAQEAADERYKRLAANMEALQMDNESMKARIAALEQKIDELRQKVSAADNNSSVQEDLKRLAESIAAVDRKREEDKQAISEEIRKSIGGLEKSLSGQVPAAQKPSIRLDPEQIPPSTENGFSYVVQDGQNLSTIVKAYNADFKSKGWKTITLKQAMDANPNVDWTHLRVGQKIIIPKPEGQ